MSLENVGNVFIKDSKFMSNVASKAGGAVLFSCVNNGVTTSDWCSLEISNTVIISNKAGISGGAIKWNSYEPSLINVTLKNNSASVYGNDIAGVAKYLVQISKDEIGSITLK